MLKYHAGQVAVQEEANTRALADHLANWVGPVAEFALQADMFILASRGSDDALHFSVLSGPAPLVDVAGPSRLTLCFPAGANLPPEGPCGGLAMNLGLARRARINGALSYGEGGCDLETAETFTLCRKYMAPSLSQGTAVLAGPGGLEELAPGDPSIAALLARAEASFLASLAPDGAPDVAHRGGPPGFLSFDPGSRRLTWTEFLGDGVFKSAGNVRATGVATLLVPDFESGDAIEFVCSAATYENTRTQRVQRLDPLVQHKDQFPPQGTITCTVDSVLLLKSAVQPRKRIEKALKVTSRSAVDEQAPQ